MDKKFVIFHPSSRGYPYQGYWAPGCGLTPHAWDAAQYTESAADGIVATHPVLRKVPVPDSMQANIAVAEENARLRQRVESLINRIDDDAKSLDVRAALIGAWDRIKILEAEKAWLQFRLDNAPEAADRVVELRIDPSLVCEGKFLIVRGSDEYLVSVDISDSGLAESSHWCTSRESAGKFSWATAAYVSEALRRAKVNGLIVPVN